MNDVRIKLTENEKIAQNVNGLESIGSSFLMTDDIDDIHNIIRREKQNKHNDQVDQYVNRLNEHSRALKESTNKLGYDLTKLEIKPMFNRVIITLFEQNPFQKITVENGIITDLGGFAPEYKNTDSGEIEEEEQMILVGVVQEAGPDCKYIREGDTVFVGKESIRPIPFFKQGFWTIGEQQIIAVVNEGLNDRFCEIKFEEKQNK